MPSERDDWTMQVRPLLGAIRSHASWVRHHCKEILDKVRMLPYRPNFETEAQAEVDTAFKELYEAQLALEAAQLTYGKKPLDAQSK